MGDQIDVMRTVVALQVANISTYLSYVCVTPDCFLHCYWARRRSSVSMVMRHHAQTTFMLVERWVFRATN